MSTIKTEDKISETGDKVSIRGVQININELFNEKLLDDAYINSLQSEIKHAEPYEHIVVQDWFNPKLLELVREEFDLFEARNWKKLHSEYEKTHRSQTHAKFGPATNMYFGIVNSGLFLNILSQISQIDDLIADPMLYGGGLHETKKGGGFAVHKDFTCHIKNGLRNEMVFITYLNKNWDPAWAGALELWDSESKHCLSSVEPEFGRSILMRNGPVNYHGHPTPLNPPEGVTRRSVASYYYSNPLAKEMREQRITSEYLSKNHQVFTNKNNPAEILKKSVKLITPPLAWKAIKKIIKR